MRCPLVTNQGVNRTRAESEQGPRERRDRPAWAPARKLARTSITTACRSRAPRLVRDGQQLRPADSEGYKLDAGGGTGAQSLELSRKLCYAASMWSKGLGVGLGLAMICGCAGEVGPSEADP